MSDEGWPVDALARDLRPGEFVYVSLESALSDWGLIPQVPISVLTVCTTGEPGWHESNWFKIEFVNTPLSRDELMRRTLAYPGRPIRFASKELALEDLRREDRNLNMLIDEEAED